MNSVKTATNIYQEEAKWKSLMNFRIPINLYTTIKDVFLLFGDQCMAFSRKGLSSSLSSHRNDFYLHRRER